MNKLRHSGASKSWREQWWLINQWPTSSKKAVTIDVAFLWQQHHEGIWKVWKTMRTDREDPSINPSSDAYLRLGSWGQWPKPRGQTSFSLNTLSSSSGNPGVAGCMNVCVCVHVWDCKNESSDSSERALFLRLILIYVKAMAHWRVCTMDWVASGMCHYTV